MGKHTPSTFRPRARIMKTLGEELISSDSVAIIELVKNSYDADATRVSIRFLGEPKKGTGTIEVVDNGNGMDIETVHRIWMEPATPSKNITKLSKAGRRVLGEKGIGRFAAARLATRTELITRRAGDPYEARAEVDWTQFDDAEKYLDEVKIISEIREPQIIDAASSYRTDFFRTNNDGPQGTFLRLSGMKNDWTNDAFQELRRALSRLISPFANLHDFGIRLQAPPGFEQYSSEIGPPEVVKFPHYTVTGNICADGAYSLIYTVERSGYREELKGNLLKVENGWILADSSQKQQNTDHPRCGPLAVELRIWDRDDLGNVVQVTGSSISHVRRELNSYAGINIYRDGFRVLPYGEPNSDWLRLDLRRVQTPTLRLSNNQIIGYISISADQNPELKDQSNREGLRDNQAKNDLDQIMLAVLARMEAIRKAARRQDTPDKNQSDRGNGLFAKPDLSSLTAHLRQTHPTDIASQELAQQAEDDFANQLNHIKEVVARYHGLVTLGQLIDMVLHQGRQPLSKIVSESTVGLEEIEDHGVDDDPVLKKVRNRLDKIRNQSAVLDGVFRRVEPFGGRKRGRPGQLYLEQILADALEIFSEQITGLEVTVLKPNSKTLVTVDAAELQEVFVNLIQNSLYWLSTVDKARRKIAIQISRPEPSVVEIIFADSGPGVPPKFREIIFDPYFSTRPEGTGLGLAVIGDIIRDYYGGSLALLDTHKLGGAAFQITLRKRV